MSNIYKGYFVQVEDENTRVVDSNELVRRKIEEEEERLARIKFLSEELGLSESGEEGEPEFVAGLEAADLSGLVNDTEQDKQPVIHQNYENAKAAEELSALQAEIEEAGAELENIKAEAESYMQNAQAQIEQMRQAAYEEAYEKGHQEGYQAGYHEADALKAEYERRSAELENDYQNMIEELEPQFIDLLSGIYEKFFKIELSGQRQLLINLLTEAINDSGEARNVVIHINKDDFQGVYELRDQILSDTGMQSDNVEFIQDGTLGTGGCMIETDNGIYDCSLETELKELRNKLLLLSRM